MSENGDARGTLRWWFEDRSTGRIVVGQTPNLLLLIFIATWSANRLAQPGGVTGKALPWVASASLVAWSLDEIARGVNPWRRALGAGVLIVEAASWLRR